MKKRAAVFSCFGVGDGLIALVLSNNLNLNGFEVTTFHPSLSVLQKWFPWTEIRPFPQLEELKGFEQIFIPCEKTPQMQAVIAECTEKYSGKTQIINPIATANRDYPYWEVGKFDGRIPFADNLKRFCERELKLASNTKECGIVIPEGVKMRAHPKRIIIHPTSSRAGKNWLPQRFDTLAEALKLRGFEPAFVMSAKERSEWEHWDPPIFSSLDEVAAFVAESGGMIGNDSGIGHLASALGLPTVTLCRSRLAGRFWRPSWSQGTVLYPPSFVPNIKGARLRDKYWKELISVRQALGALLTLLPSSAWHT